MKVYPSLIISFLLHACALMAILLIPSKGLFQKPVEIEIVSQSETESRPRQYVTETQKDLDTQIKDLKDKAEHLSRLTRRVKEEMIARRSGPTINRSGQGNRTTDFEKPSSDSSIHENSNSETQPPSITAPNSEWLNSGNRQQRKVGENAQMGDSTISEFIPDVKEGGYTSLNQDQFVYYTFYSRINGQIRNRWVNQIKNFLNQTQQQEVNRLSRKPQQTVVEVLITPEGDFVKAMIHQQAENSELDKSVINAFRLASPFVNPPLELVANDGYIHLHYGFYLQFRPRYLASGSK